METGGEAGQMTEEEINQGPELKPAFPQTSGKKRRATTGTGTMTQN